MLLKIGVDISRLKRVLRRKLQVIDTVVAELENDEAVITSTYEGTHSPSSLHYIDEAVDIRSGEQPFSVIGKLKQELGPDFDVVFEGDHIHIEYDPK